MLFPQPAVLALAAIIRKKKEPVLWNSIRSEVRAWEKSIYLFVRTWPSLERLFYRFVIYEYLILLDSYRFTAQGNDASHGFKSLHWMLKNDDVKSLYRVRRIVALIRHQIVSDLDIRLH